ncbi:hypothetical protein B0T14DRAFT_560690 [Immersiella caudata]|uniref:Anaphase-promoting complex, subunit CDC26 n=1 Tax=Immersiella caudata TaxID=314043 RepID=A0AA40CCF6_9PEZI|nr:hypothetical protein B0T14DRAFT_560690 [Immersiella caudata]
MLRRPLTVLTVTAEDIADYEDRTAERLRQRDLLLQARARREAIAAHHAASVSASARRRVLGHSHPSPAPNPNLPSTSSDPPTYPYANQGTPDGGALPTQIGGAGIFSPPAAPAYGGDLSSDEPSEEEADEDVSEEDDDDEDGMDVDGASGMAMQVTPTMARGQHAVHYQQQQGRVEGMAGRRGEEQQQERGLRGQGQGVSRGGRGGGVPAVTPEGRVQRSREERIGVAAPQRRRQQ